MTRRLSPSQQLAVLAGAAHDADAAHALLWGPARREPLCALDTGAVRAAGALLGWYASAIRFRGVPGVLGAPAVFAQALRMARHRAVEPVVRHAVTGMLDTEAVRQLLARAWLEWPAIQAEGVDLVWALYERGNARPSAAAALGDLDDRDDAEAA